MGELIAEEKGLPNLSVIWKENKQNYKNKSSNNRNNSKERKTNRKVRRVIRNPKTKMKKKRS